MRNRWHISLVFAALAAATFSGAAAWAQDYPTRPITIIVAQPPGGENGGVCASQ